MPRLAGSPKDSGAQPGTERRRAAIRGTGGQASERASDREPLRLLLLLPPPLLRRAEEGGEGASRVNVADTRLDAGEEGEEEGESCLRGGCDPRYTPCWLSFCLFLLSPSSHFSPPPFPPFRLFSFSTMHFFSFGVPSLRVFLVLIHSFFRPPVYLAAETMQ